MVRVSVRSKRREKLDCSAVRERERPENKGSARPLAENYESRVHREIEQVRHVLRFTRDNGDKKVETMQNG